MIPKLYATMTGELQCVVIDGVLYVREWPRKCQYTGRKNPNPWKRSKRTRYGLESIPVGMTDRARRRAVCQLHAVDDIKPSLFRCDRTKLESIERQIEVLKAEIEKARINEVDEIAGAVALSRTKF